MCRTRLPYAPKCTALRMKCLRNFQCSFRTTNIVPNRLTDDGMHSITILSGTGTPADFLALAKKS